MSALWQNVVIRRITNCLYTLKSQQQIALKILKADESKNNKELSILLHLASSELGHPGKTHVIELLNQFYHTGPNGNHLCLVFPMMISDGMALTITEVPHQAEYVQNNSRQLLLGLDFLHQSGIVHCGESAFHRPCRQSTADSIRSSTGKYYDFNYWTYA